MYEVAISLQFFLKKYCHTKNEEMFQMHRNLSYRYLVYRNHVPDAVLL